MFRNETSRYDIRNGIRKHHSCYQIEKVIETDAIIGLRRHYKNTYEKF